MSLIARKNVKSPLAIIAILVVIAAGIWIVFRALAAPVGVGIEPERATISNPATVASDFSASSGQAVAFRASTPTPIPTPTPSGTQHVLTINGPAFYLDGTRMQLWGARTASATKDDAQANHLIAQLDDYKSHGVNSVTVFYQGCRGAKYDPFSSDGRTINAGHEARMEKIIKAANDRGMVVIVGLYYFAAPLNAKDGAAVRTTVKTVARALKPYRNIIINIANEQNSTEYRDTNRKFNFNDPKRIIELAGIIKTEDPSRLVGGGGFSEASNKVIGKAATIDALLYDAAGNGVLPAAGPLYDKYIAAGITKPIVNVELLGGWTKQFPRGIFGASIQSKYKSEVDAGISRPNLGIFFHNNPWMQDIPMRYDLAGIGTSASPGIRWYFDYVKLKRGL